MTPPEQAEDGSSRKPDHVEDMDYHEIAAIMGTSARTVETQVLRPERMIRSSAF